MRMSNYLLTTWNGIIPERFVLIKQIYGNNTGELALYPEFMLNHQKNSDVPSES